MTTTEKLSTLGKWAMRYAEKLELAIYPIRPRDKRALHIGWTQDATSDLATVAEWWHVNPHANIGVLLGKCDMVAIDVDTEVMDLWRELVAEMKKEHGVDLEATWVAETPGGGLHVFYRANGIAYASERMRGIEVKAGNHGMVLAPSVHPDTGTRYGWAMDQAPGEIDLASVPACLEPLLPRESQRKSRTHHAAGEVALSWPEILEPYGWTAVNPNGDSVTRWRRAGKRDGHSATTNYDERDTLYIFSENAEPFEAEHSYNRLAAYALLNYGGNVVAAREALGIEEPSAGATPASVNVLVTATQNDLGNADRLIGRYGNILHFVELWRQWLIWDGWRWAKDLGTVVRWHAQETARATRRAAADLGDADEGKKALQSWARASGQAFKIRGMIECAQSLTDVCVTPDELDTQPMLLNCLNGTLDLSTSPPTLRPHRREDLITKLAPVEYHPDACAPIWEYVIDSASCNDEELIAFKQRNYGYGITGATSEQCFSILYGLGMNGKSTELEAIRGVLGPDYAVHADTATFLTRRTETIRNDLAALRGARFVTAIETEQGKRLAEALVKQVTGNDPVTARFLFQEYFTFVPEFKLFLAVNHKPTIRGQDHAMWRRINLVPYNNTIPLDERDGDLSAKLATKEEREGILRWLVDGCADWVANGLNPPESVRAATAAYRDEMDTLGQFIGDACILGVRCEVTTKALHAAFVAWCETNGEKPLSKRIMGERLKGRNFEPHRGTGGVRKWLGLGIRGDEIS